MSTLELINSRRFAYLRGRCTFLYRPATSIKQMHQCARKLAHYNFLSALHHATRLRTKEPTAHFSIYPCQFCPALHVGHMKKGRSAEITEDYEDYFEEAA